MVKEIAKLVVVKPVLGNNKNTGWKKWALQNQIVNGQRKAP